MATMIEMVRATRLICGIQGTGPTSVSSAQGIEEVIVRSVRDAYLDIQNHREEWNFLREEGSFITVASQDTYSLFNIFGVDDPSFKKYRQGSFIITDSNGQKRYLVTENPDVLEARYLNEDDEKLPTQYTVDPPTNSIILKPIPDGVYTVDFQYWRNPEILTADTDVPSLPLTFHNLIIYKAAEKMATYLSISEVYREYSLEAAKMMGQLMRLEIPKKRMNAGALV